MKKQQRIGDLKKEINNLMGEMNGRQLDFIDQYMITYTRIYNKEDDKMDFIKSFTSLNYLYDDICEFADNDISVYYDDQIEYYREHVDECMDAFKEYGFELKNFDDLELAVAKAGACGWYAEVYDALCDHNRLEELNDLIEELEELEEGLNNEE